MLNEFSHFISILLHRRCFSAAFIIKMIPVKKLQIFNGEEEMTELHKCALGALLTPYKPN